MSCSSIHSCLRVFGVLKMEFSLNPIVVNEGVFAMNKSWTSFLEFSCICSHSNFKRK